MHFFDGFRTSHELATIDLIDEQTLRDLIDPRDLAAHRLRGLDPDRPVLRGTAQNPDVFFQAREAANPFHDGRSGHRRTRPSIASPRPPAVATAWSTTSATRMPTA